jgi:putative cardiolipin synthase
MSDSYAREETLEAGIAKLVRAHAGRSGVRLVADGFDAFALRVQSARAAQRTLDVQTYIWRDDSTGRFIANELVQAADRGVHVRVLLDDMDARPRDLALEALDAHRSIEVRMFNPFRTRSGALRTLAEVLQRGRRLNHRMHNKCWIADGALAISGGRNLGDEYFSSAQEINFIDLDLLLLGPAVASCAAEFESYWRCELSVPISRLRKYSRRKLTLTRLRSRLHGSTKDTKSEAFASELADGRLTTWLRPDFVWSRNVRVVADDPSKALGGGAQASHVLESMVDEMRAASREVLLISPYFVPGIGGTAALRSLARQGAEVAVLTNSLAATDVAIVHSGYAKYRLPLLEAGVRLFELKATLVFKDARARMRLGSSRASLHTKAAVIDGERVFVGSFNIDPRSADLNCEMGVWVRSHKLALALTNSFRSGCDPQRSYHLAFRSARSIEWAESVNGVAVHHQREPGTSWMRRALVRVLELLPIESQL